VREFPGYRMRLAGLIERTMGFSGENSTARSPVCPSGADLLPADPKLP